MDAKAALVEMGLFRLEERLPVLLDRVRGMVLRAGTNEPGEKFEAFPSFIPASHETVPRGNVLAVDIGGTSTKVGLRLSGPEHSMQWRMLFERKNDELITQEIQENPYRVFIQSVVDRIIAQLRKEKELLKGGFACGVVWSNALINQPQGRYVISGTVTQSDHYKKGEWFVEGLRDGEDLGSPFLKAFEAVQCDIHSFLISNDTPLTMTAAPEAHAGIVASTGLNGTVVKTLRELGIADDDKPVICNGEMGGRCRLEREFMSDGDIRASEDHTLETLTAGRFLPKIFVGHILCAAEMGVPGLADIADYLRSQQESGLEEFRPHDMSLLLSDQKSFLARRADPVFRESMSLESLRYIAKGLLMRAAKITALVSLASISNQKQSSYCVALDSRLAREIPLFWKTLKTTFTELTEEVLKTEGKIVLLDRLQVAGGKISVPMQGVAAGLDALTDG